MRWIILILLAVNSSVVHSEDVDEGASNVNTRETGVINQDNWRSIENLPIDWSSEDRTIQPKPKRRRLRKRKRRPIQNQDYEEINTNRPLRRRSRPHRLDQNFPINDWQEDEIKPPSSRRRLVPIYDENTEQIFVKIDTESIESKGQSIESKEESRQISDLKMILKQNKNELSLSEILQKNNLSLPELLSGNEKAISALTEAPRKATTEPVLKIEEESGSERRVFVPSHPKYYTSVNFKPEFDGKIETTTIKIKPKHIELNFALPIKVHVEESVGYNKILSKLDEPLRMPIDLTQLVNNNNTPDSTENPMENITLVTARDEIMEVLKDPVSRERLSKALQNRNMTVDELVKQRERGSSQLHLADIFHNKTREPEPEEEPFVGEIKPDFHEIDARESKQITENHTKLPIPLIENKTVIDETKSNEPSTTNIESYPWRGYKSEILPVPIFPSEQTQFPTEDYLFKEVPRLEDIDNNYQPSLNLNSDEDTEIFYKIPSGVKSAIFVSLAIIGLSILVFLTILMIFKWSQKQAKNINYCSSLSARFKSPMIFEAGPTTAIRTFVHETLGRKKNYYKSNVQRMCDDIWEGGAEKKLSY